MYFFLRFFIVFHLFSLAWANQGYIKHQIINHTSSELYVGIRQQFFYPLDGCFGIIDANSEKECSGDFEIGYANFMMEVIKNTVIREELRSFANFKNYVQNPAFMVTWIIDFDSSNNLKISYQARNI